MAVSLAGLECLDFAQVVGVADAGRLQQLVKPVQQYDGQRARPAADKIWPG